MAAVRDAIMREEVPKCGIGGCRGVMKPDITFFGEKLSGDVEESIEHDREEVIAAASLCGSTGSPDSDRPRCLQIDLLLVLGTSMKVAPMSQLPYMIPPDVPQVLINRLPMRRAAPNTLITQP